MDPMTKASSPSRGSNRRTLMAQTLRVMRTSASRRGRPSPRQRRKLSTLKIVVWTRIHCQEIKRAKVGVRGPNRWGHHGRASPRPRGRCRHCLESSRRFLGPPLTLMAGSPCRCLQPDPGTCRRGSVISQGRSALDSLVNGIDSEDYRWQDLESKRATSSSCARASISLRTCGATVLAKYESLNTLNKPTSPKFTPAPSGASPS